MPQHYAGRFNVGVFARQFRLRPENTDYGRLLTESVLPLLSAQETEILSSLPRLLARQTKTADYDQDQVPT